MRNYPKIARKISRTLFFAQVVVSSGLIMMATVSAIAGAELSGRDAWAGVPSAVVLFASAAGAVIWGVVMERLGRRVGLVIGLAFGACGALLAGGALIGRTFPVFLAGLGMVGLAQAAMLLGRYAAADVHPVERRGTAISNVVVGGTVGSIVGPLLVGPMSRLGVGGGFNELFGAYIGGFALLSTAALIIIVWLRPEPATIRQEIAQEGEEQTRAGGPTRSISEIIRQPAVIVAAAAMVIGQLVMVILMVITSLYMKQNGNSLGQISLVISAHTFGMFAFSILSGRLADRIGRTPVIVIGSLTLVAACLGSMLPPTVLTLGIALFLLGLGWNFCFVGGSTLLTDQLSAAEMPRIQGFNDLLVSLASAFGSLISGFVFASAGYRPMGIAGAVLSLVPLFLALWWGRANQSLGAVQLEEREAV